MSVAFRRESDEEHLEPKFERPIAPGPNLVTPRGLDLIRAEVVRLEAVIASAAPDAVDALRRDLRYWHTRQATAELAPPPPEGEIGIGSRVTIRQNGQARTIEIVGGDEADPAAGRIGFQAPLARALIGGYKDEAVAFAGNTITIVEIA
ncbi:Transcription elongation factor, GreA/GreB family [Sphingomonas gellani]|uniref:Transcription elongation factor, GreA/GreB family n=1 Tax=Sphingomonas gellani TaxID=1166340 RepID=A0A1H7YE40_9SPHN|nr:GreA/GreB family elongation factor [Sphingomonas gellani]SEM43449.1 Transcription elongation factor, GreA/GreB family [Sphingomonas gellani]